MRRIAFAVAAAVAIATSTLAAQDRPAVLGAWRLPSWMQEGQQPSQAQRGLFIFTSTNSGRYTVSGDTIVTRAYVAKDPNYMSGWPENAQRWRFRIDGDILHLTMGNGTRATLQRVEGRPAPY